jgi:hypothetical protein
MMDSSAPGEMNESMLILLAKIVGHSVERDMANPYDPPRDDKPEPETMCHVRCPPRQQ